MANEIQVTASLTYSKNSIPSESLAPATVNVTQTGNRMNKRVLTVNNTDTTIPIPEGTLGYALFKNLDASITINLKTAAGGTIIISLLAGEVALFRYGSGVTAPVAISASGTPFLEYFIIET